MNVIELVHISSKTELEEVTDTDNAGISLVSNYSTGLENNLLSNKKSTITGWVVAVSFFLEDEGKK